MATQTAVRTKAPIFRAFSSFDKKERGDEARFFAEQEKEKLAAMRAKVEAILASESHEDKEELLEILCKYAYVFS